MGNLTLFPENPGLKKIKTKILKLPKETKVDLNMPLRDQIFTCPSSPASKINRKSKNNYLKK